MNDEKVQALLVQLTTVIENVPADSAEYFQAGRQYQKLLFAHMTLREYEFITQNVTHELNLADEARLITAAAQGKMLSQVVDLNEDAQIAYQLRWLRKKKQLTQTEVAAQVGMTQSQIAKIERAQVEVSLPRLRRLLQAVGGDLEWRVVS